MGNKTYNVYFNLHTVSGIVISALLYIIFFAGAFTLFKDSIHHWEDNKEEIISTERPIHIDYNRIVAVLQTKYDLYGRSIYITPKDQVNQRLYLSGSEDTAASKESKKNHRLIINTNNYSISEQKDDFSLGRLLYNLHFYYQLGLVGYYFSGLVAFIFLFAIVTGIIVHWKKVRSNFYTFRPLAKLKTIWTDAHTALGTIGIPFQILYALTGTMFGLGILVSTSASVFYKGDTKKFNDIVFHEDESPLAVRDTALVYDLNALNEQASRHWQGFKADRVALINCDSKSMQLKITGSITPVHKFYNEAEIVYDVSTGKMIHEKNPGSEAYSDKVLPTVYKLHYADYGDLGPFSNYLLKFIYFLMAAITCFVIITGVLIWLEARNKKNIPEKKRKFNQGVGNIYMAVCLSLLPVTAFSFIVSKLLPASLSKEREVILNAIFFGGWLMLILFFWLKKSIKFTNKWTLLSGGLMGVFIPVISGIYSNNWLWHSLKNDKYDIFMIDAIWLFIAIISLYTFKRIRHKERLVL